MITGTTELINQLLAFGKEAEQFVKDETKAVGAAVMGEARQNAGAVYSSRLDERTKSKVDRSLIDGISFKMTNNDLTTEISQNLLPMGAYIEFGTGIHVEVDPEWQDIAWEFYVNGKGRLRATPYLYPAYTKGRKLYLEKLEKGLERLTEKYNGKP